MWKDLSIAQRSQLMNLMRHNGITSLSEMRRIYDNSSPSLFPLAENTSSLQPQAPVYDEGGPKKTKDEYLREKAQEVISAALERSKTRKMPAVPQVWKSAEEFKAEREKERQEFKENWTATFHDWMYPWAYQYEKYDMNANLVSPFAKSFFEDGDYEMLMEVKRQQERALNEPLEEEETGGYVNGRSCIYTATDNYGKQYRVSGNQTFASNPAKYGFVEIPMSELQPGDLVQDWSSGHPSHALIFDRYEVDGTPLFNYSNGDDTEKAIRRSAYYSNSILQDGKAYRFIGTDKDRALWEDEYNNSFSGGGHKIHIKKENRGKFTALKKRTGKSASWFKAHGTPAQKRMAVFALNARKWKHSHGGIKF